MKAGRLSWDMTSSGSLKRPGRKSGSVFEEQNFYPRLSVWQNLSFFARLYGKSREKVKQVFEFVNLEKRIRDEAGNLSRGLKQRLLIARAFLPGS